MSRYRVEEPNAVSNTLDIYGPDGQVIGQIYRAGDTESRRFKHFIEDYDEIVEVLRNAAKIAFDITAGDMARRRNEPVQGRENGFGANHGDVLNQVT